MFVLIYQLPNGKIIRLSIEEYLELTDEEIIYIVSLDFGESAANPWTGSVLPSNCKRNVVETNDDDDLDVNPTDIPGVDYDDLLDIPEGFDND